MVVRFGDLAVWLVVPLGSGLGDLTCWFCMLLVLNFLDVCCCGWVCWLFEVGL